MLFRSNAYTYSDSDQDSYFNTHIYSYFHCDSNSYCYGNRDFYTDSGANDHTIPITYANRDGPTQSYTNTNSDRDFYTDTNASTHADCSNGWKSNQCDCYQLYRELEERKRCDGLPVGCVHERFLCHLRTRVQEFGRRQYN